MEEEIISSSELFFDEIESESDNEGCRINLE